VKESEVRPTLLEETRESVENEDYFKESF